MSDQGLSSEGINGFSINVTDLSKRFNREWIFRNLTFQFTAGNTYAITGPNGSGKSTLLQVLWGQVPQTSGTLKYHSAKADIPVENISEHISIATPYMDLIDEFTLQEQLDFHFKLKKVRNEISMNELLEIMYLTEAKDKFIGNFSSGMKQRVKLALAFYTEADILFLDEPSTNLDQLAFSWYKRQVEMLPEQLIFIASNNPEEYPSNARVFNLLNYKI